MKASNLTKVVPCEPHSLGPLALGCSVHGACTVHVRTGPTVGRLRRGPLLHQQRRATGRGDEAEGEALLCLLRVLRLVSNRFLQEFEFRFPKKTSITDARPVMSTKANSPSTES